MPAPAAPVTDTAEVRARRAACEARILADLKQLCAATGGDLESLTVRTCAIVPDLSPGNTDEPQLIPFAVKIVLAF